MIFAKYVKSNQPFGEEDGLTRGLQIGRAHV